VFLNFVNSDFGLCSLVSEIEVTKNNVSIMIVGEVVLEFS